VLGNDLDDTCRSKPYINPKYQKYRNYDIVWYIDKYVVCLSSWSSRQICGLLHIFCSHVHCVRCTTPHYTRTANHEHPYVPQLEHTQPTRPTIAVNTYSVYGISYDDKTSVGYDASPYSSRGLGCFMSRQRQRVIPHYTHMA
jgi:hypothetical protein